MQKIAADAATTQMILLISVKNHKVIYKIITNYSYSGRYNTWNNFQNAKQIAKITNTPALCN